MTQAIKLKKDFEIAVSSIEDHIKNLSKNKLENEELISKLENENSILKSRIEELEQTSINNNEPELGFVNDTKSASLPFSNDDNEILKDLHKKDIEEVAYKVAVDGTKVKVEANGKKYQPQEISAMILQKMKKMAESIAESMGGECEFKIVKGYPFLVNDEVVTSCAKQSAIDFLGKENVIDLDLRMTAEDFAYFSQEKPSCFYRLGVKNEAKNINSGLHTSTFNIDEDAIETSIGLMAWLTVKELN